MNELVELVNEEHEGVRVNVSAAAEPDNVERVELDALGLHLPVSHVPARSRTGADCTRRFDGVGYATETNVLEVVTRQASPDRPRETCIESSEA